MEVHKEAQALKPGFYCECGLSCLYPCGLASALRGRALDPHVHRLTRTLLRGISGSRMGRRSSNGAGSSVYQNTKETITASQWANSLVWVTLMDVATLASRCLCNCGFASCRSCRFVWLPLPVSFHFVLFLKTCFSVSSGIRLEGMCNFSKECSHLEESQRRRLIQTENKAESSYLFLDKYYYQLIHAS